MEPRLISRPRREPSGAHRGCSLSRSSPRTGRCFGRGNAINRMKARLLLVALERETDIVLARKRTRKLAELIGFDAQDQTRITTAVSEIVRNAFEYAGQGKIEFRLTGSTKPQLFEIIVRDQGPGIAHLDAILDGSRR